MSNKRKNSWKLSKYLDGDNLIFEIRCVSTNKDYNVWVHLKKVKCSSKAFSSVDCKEITKEFTGKFIPIDSFIHRYGLLEISKGQIESTLRHIINSYKSNYSNIILQFVFVDDKNEKHYINYKYHISKSKIHFF